MKSILVISLILSLSSIALSDNTAGRIVRASGTYYINDFKLNANSYTKIKKKDLIEIKSKATIELILNDNSAIKVYGPVKFEIIHTKRKYRDLPTYIKVKYGRIRIMQNNKYLSHSLTVLTNNSMIKSVNSWLDIVTTTKVDKVLSRFGQFGIANLVDNIRNALIVKPGYEVVITKNSTPGISGYIKTRSQKNWINNNIISRKDNSIVEYQINDGVVEWLLTPEK